MLILKANPTVTNNIQQQPTYQTAFWSQITAQLRLPPDVEVSSQVVLVHVAVFISAGFQLGPVRENQRKIQQNPRESSF